MTLNNEMMEVFDKVEAIGEQNRVKIEVKVDEQMISNEYGEEMLAKSDDLVTQIETLVRKLARLYNEIGE